MAELTIEQQRAIALAKARVAAEETAAPPAPVSTVKGLTGFGNTGGLAAVGNPMLKANNPKPESDIPLELGGTVTDMLAKTGLPPEVSAAGGYMANVGAQAVPVLLGGGGGAAAAPVVAKTGERLMASALKPTLGMWQKGQGERAIKTMLDEGLNVTEGGVKALRTKIDDLHSQVENIIANSTEKIDITPVTQAFQKLKDKVTNQASWETDLKTVNDSFKEFLNNPHIKNLTDRLQDLPIDVAQKIKRGTQQSVADAFGAKGTAWEESQKGIAAVLRQGIEKAAPEVAPLNAHQSDLLNALKVAGRRFMMDENKNPIGLAALTHSPEGFLAHMASGSAAAKSMLANLLYPNAGKITTTIGAGTGASLADLQR